MGNPGGFVSKWGYGGHFKGDQPCHWENEALNRGVEWLQVLRQPHILPRLNGDC